MLLLYVVVPVDTDSRNGYPTRVMYKKQRVRGIGYTVVFLLLVAAVVAVLTAGDSRASEVPTDDGKGALELANRWRAGEPDVHTYVDAAAVYFLFPDDELVEARLPAGEMVIAAAPYINSTHPCAIHAISGCQAELVNEPVQVTVFDESGVELFSTETETMDNGFVELWLPLDRRYTLRFEARGLSVETRAETFADSPTCLTNLKLS